MTTARSSTASASGSPPGSPRSARSARSRTSTAPSRPRASSTSSSGNGGIEYLADGIAVEDALDALLAADDGSAQRQLHGVDRSDTFAFSGDECRSWYGHREEEGFTVAGNLLVGEDTIDATAETYADSRHELPAGPARPDGDGDPAPLAERLIDALEAGHAAGGDKREDLTVQSAALLVTSTEDRDLAASYDDLRVDASETPIQDLRETYELAHESFVQTLERYGDAYEEDAVGPGSDELSVADTPENDIGESDED